MNTNRTAADLVLDFRMGYGAPFGLDLFETALKIGTRNPIALVHTGHPKRSVCEKVVHLLERTLGGLGQEAVEEDCVGQIANLWS